VLEDKVLDPACDDLEKLLDKLLPLVLLNVRLEAQLLPQLLRALNDIGVGLCGFALLDESLLLGVRFARVAR
jgi:hypothetical protein